MSTTKKIEQKINSLDDGQVFTYEQLNLTAAEYRAAVKALGRMTQAGIIKRAATGRYYKPMQSAFGELKPAEDELVKPYLFEKGKRIAYITGEALYNKMGLTTQVSKNIKVASREKRIIAKIGNLVIKPVKSYVEVTDQNYQILGTLDAIKDFKEIPDLDKKTFIKILFQQLKAFPKKELEQLITISLKYPPRVRALTGALLSRLGTEEKKLLSLSASLNPLSSYNLGIKSNELPEINQWNIT